jgi:hypothetical protein
VEAQHPPHPVGRQADGAPLGPGELGCDAGQAKAGMTQGEGDYPLLHQHAGLVSHPRYPALPRPQDLRAVPVQLPLQRFSRWRDGSPSPGTPPARCRARRPALRSVDESGTAGHPASRRRFVSPRLGGQGEGCVAALRQWGCARYRYIPGQDTLDPRRVPSQLSETAAGLKGWLHHLRTDGCVGGGGGRCGPGDCQQQNKTRYGRGGGKVSRCG